MLYICSALGVTLLIVRIAHRKQVCRRYSWNFCLVSPETTAAAGIPGFTAGRLVVRTSPGVLTLCIGTSRLCAERVVIEHHVLCCLPNEDLRDVVVLAL